MIFSWILSGVVAVMNGYLWRRLVRDTRLGPVISSALSLLLFVLATTIPVTLLYWGLVSRTSTPTLAVIAFAWLGASFYLVLWFASWDALRVARSVWRRTRKPVLTAPKPPEPAQLPANALSTERMRVAPTETTSGLQEREGRRVFMARSVASGALLAAGGISTFGVRSALWEITTPEIAVGLPRLPKPLDGFSIALLTDVHIGAMLDGRFLRQLAEQTNRLRPDMIAIAGDLVDGRVEQIGAQVAELRKLRAPHGVYFVTGNHEYYSDVNAWIAFLSRMGVRALSNERVSIGDASPEGASFDLAGLPDCRAAHVGYTGPDIQVATRGRDPERELVVLAHQPVQIDAISKAQAGLQLAGHTHGGQLYPFGSIARLAQPYISGLHRHAPTNTQIYVSRGTGFWGPPMRVMAPAEVTMVRLYAS